MDSSVVQKAEAYMDEVRKKKLPKLVRRYQPTWRSSSEKLD
jgi:hypothetical protein